MTTHQQPATVGAYLADHLRRQELSYRQAAEISGLPSATLNALVTRPPGLLKRSTRDGLVRLGLDADVVDQLAAQQAGLALLHLTTDELQLLATWRSIPVRKRALVRHYLSSFSKQPTKSDRSYPD